MLGVLSGQIIVIVNPLVWVFEGMIQGFKVTTIGMYVHGIQDNTKEHFSFIVWLFFAYRAVTHDGGFVRGWNGTFILKNCPLAC